MGSEMCIRDRTTCVWVGLDTPATIVDRGYGGSLALPIWAAIYKKAASLRDTSGNPRYPANDLDPGLIYARATLCRLSGKRVTAGCQSAGTAYQDLVPEGLVPANNDYCTVHPLRAMPAPQTQSTRRPQRAPQHIPQRQTLPSQPTLRALPIETPSSQLPSALPVPDYIDEDYGAEGPAPQPAQPLRALPVE